ncbi:DUF805 domain-containing protein [Staphylococcus condimenti]|uniref:DUF805 domain-containing protein n=1 Tax=Staphylococcus condimenti TaxID=70255 RepID=A0A143PF63_9STAP|nr:MULTISPECIES: DUF805 domain-containing protein [Staphylococcus]AMY06414.1 hypothetical protein A4G25_10930 [Staphylococcus condimenti]APR60296.1 hypothetical protein BTZ13_03345 [Staphylococcus condimenti]MDK8644243.1 DUF805 domain-containing protein [Staphylococcus condimenti]OFP00258.1 hypothetical protein HMPREF3007_11775 [Staphylococcus sp. HMSC065E08]PNZ61949.1 DUF805 domain-containing protein [Staphylococcus condimenti]
MEERVSFGEAFILFWKNYINFTGRARRAEFWWWMLWSSFLFVPLSALAIIIVAAMFFTLLNGLILDMFFSLFVLIICVILFVLICLVLFIPNLSLLIRRFHDTGRSMIVPIIYMAVILGYNFIQPIVAANINENNSVLWIFALLFMLTFTGLTIYILIVVLLPSQPEDNKYGRGPAGKKFEQGHTPTSHKSYSETTSGSHHTHYE